MAQPRRIRLHFPLGGINRRRAYAQQPPYTTPYAINVRPYDTGLKRERGGARPGLSNYATVSGVDYLAEITTAGGTARLLAISGAVLHVDNGTGTFTGQGSALNSSVIPQIAVHGQKAYISNYGTTDVDMPQVCALAGSTAEWVADYYPLVVFSSGGTDYPVYQRNNVYPWIYDADGNAYPGWPHTTAGTAFGGNMYSSNTTFADTWAYNASHPGYPAGTKSYVMMTTDGELYDYDGSDERLVIESSALVGYAKGIVPQQNPLICRWQDRIVLAGSPAHVWYMSRAGDPLDWDYSRPADDFGRAVAGTTSEAGTVGDPIVALMPYQDDFLCFGCATSIWVLRGNPTAGGQITCVSRNVGVIQKNAWCYGPTTELVFLSQGGLYVIAPYPNQNPVALSEAIPNKLIDVASTSTVSMAFDADRRGLLVSVTPSSGTGSHWWFDWDSRSWWEILYNTTTNDHQPIAMARKGADVYLACKDGKIRYFNDSASQDDDKDIPTSLVIGPFPLARGIDEGIINTIDALLGDDSGDVDWSLHVGQTAEDAAKDASNDTNAVASGTWSAGQNYRDRPRRRGRWAAIRLEQTITSEAAQWYIEEIYADLLAKGVARKA